MSFTQKQLEEAYTQMQAERHTDETFAQTAASNLATALNLKYKFSPVVAHSFASRGGITPFTTDHVLTVQMSQHDDWNGCVNDLSAAGVKMKPWNGLFTPGPEGEFDVSSNTQFAGRTKKSYRVHIAWYDGGY